MIETILKELHQKYNDKKLMECRLKYEVEIQ